MPAGHVGVFCQNLGITAYTLENYSNFKNKFSFNNGSILEINDYYNRSRGNLTFAALSDIILYQIKILLVRINLDEGQLWQRLRKCV